MIDYMKHMKAWRLDQERLELLQERRNSAIQVWQKYKRKNPSADITPSIPEFWERHDVKAIIQLPSHIPVNATNFSEVEKRIPAWISQWRESKKRDIYYRADVNDLPWARLNETQESHLNLAVCVFTCSKYLCFKKEEEEDHDNMKYYPMFYPEYLHHRCNRICRINWEIRDDEDPDNPSLRLGPGYPRHTQRQAWSSEELVFDEKASKVARKIVEACGWNWQVMKAEEMDKRDPRIVCMKCTYGHKCDGERIVTVMTWRKAVRAG
jgi:hypothetical protein